MLSSKSKSVILETSVDKSSPATPRSSKLGRAGALKADLGTPSSPKQASRLSLDRSPRSFDHKITTERPKTSTPQDKQPRAIKGSEAQMQLAAAQEDLKKAKEQLASVEEEKTRLVEELKGAKNSADEAKEKLQEALAAQRKAEEASEIDKFRADEMEQASIEAIQQREEEWQKEVESVQNQHALDVAALLATTDELQRVKHELSMTTEAKNSALSHADDAMKIAEINAGKVELLHGELNRLKALLDSAKESKSIEALERQKNEGHLLEELVVIQEELKNANERLASIEKEKTQLLEELKETKRFSDGANAKLTEDLAIQRRMLEALEMEKLRAIELEQESSRAAQEREEQWIEEFKSIQKQHSADVAAFCSTKEELERMKHELVVIVDEKNAALSQADNMMKIAEINREKIELLSDEISELKNQLDSKLQLEDKLSALELERETAKEAERKFLEMEELIHELRMENSNRMKAKSDADQLADEWKKKAELLDVHLQEANQSAKSSADSLASVMKQMEEKNNLLDVKECEISALKAKVQSLEIDVDSYKASHDESIWQLNAAKEETLERKKAIDGLKYDLQTAEETKNHLLINVKMVTSKIESIMEEKNNLINELEAAQIDAEEVRNAMKSLTSELHQVSVEATEAQEKLLSKQAEAEDARARIEDLKLTIEKTRENYETRLHKATLEMAHLQETVESFEREVEQSRGQWHSKEVNYMGSITRLEKEIAAMESEIRKLVESLKGAEIQVQAAKEGQVELLSKLKQLEFEVIVAMNAAEAAKAESLRLKEMLLDKENELQNVCQENDDLQIRENAALRRAEEVSKLLADTTIKKPEEDNAKLPLLSPEPSESTTNFGLLKDLEENANEEDQADKTKLGASTGKTQDHSSKRRSKDTNEHENGKEEPPELEGQMQENGKMDRDESVQERKSESAHVESDVRIDGDGNDLANELLSENSENGQQNKKKKAFMQRFGSLLRRKSNQK